MTTNPYFEPFTLDGEQRKPLVEYGGFRPYNKLGQPLCFHLSTGPYFSANVLVTLPGSDKRKVFEILVPDDIALALTRCRVLERLDEFGLVTIGRQGGDFVARLMPYGNGEPMFAVASDRDAALNELAHRIAKEAGL